MSADNWATCPRCVHRAQKAHEAASLEVGALYGKIPHDEWLAKNAALKPVDVSDSQFCTFREDYEFYGADAGIVCADFSGHCTACDLGTTFKREQRFWSATEEPA